MKSFFRRKIVAGRSFRAKFELALRFITMFVLFSSSLFAENNGSLRGQVTDPSGAAIPFASVALIAPGAAPISAETSAVGAFGFPELSVGTYSLRVSAAGFSSYIRHTVEVNARSVVTLDVRLALASAQQEITVADTIELDVDPSKNVSATVLQGQSLEMFSDDPDDLQSDLLALAGPAGGPDGGQIFVDGFSNGQLPPKNSIREVRVNSNPFSAEFDKLGYGRIEIFTKPGSSQFHGSHLAQFDTSVLDTRNPFGVVKPSYLSRQFDGDASGPWSRKLSWFVDYSYRRQNDQALVNATVLDSQFRPTAFVQNVATPNTRAGVSPRVDYQLTPNVTFGGRFIFVRYGNDNVGVGQFNLPSAGTNTRSDNYSAQATATWVANRSAVNETRFQLTRSDTMTSGANQSPVINVAGAFTGGAAATGAAFLNQDAYEFQNYTSITHGTHLIRFGARLRGTLQDTGTNQNFNGTFYFSSLGAYSTTLAGVAQSLPWSQIVANGGGAFQYVVATGTPLASAGVVDAEPFLQDDWRVRPNLTLSLGARYEVQNHISDKADITPRAGIAWGIGKKNGSQNPQLVLRAGFGTFFDRLSIAQILNAERFNGVNQSRYVIESPDFFAGDTPPVSQLAAGQPVTSYRIDSNLVAPRAYESMLSLERQLPKNIATSVTYVNSRGVHELRTRNINAPLPGTYTFGNPSSGVYPLGNPNPLDLYESSGLFKQTQIVWNVNAKVNAKFSLSGYYMWARASANTDGVNTFPANSYDLSNEWSRSLYEARNRVFMGGNLELPWAIGLAPSINYYSPMPYNIVIGEDVNGDGQSNDRPSYATKADNPAYVVQTAYGALNLRPLPGETIIPRNLGTGFSSFTVNLRTSRTWGFGEARGTRAKHYNVTLSVEARNLLNTVNPGAPVGVLTSSLFGQAQGLSTVGSGTLTQSANRRLQLQLRFAF
jgi:hypothetical protein